MHISFNFTGIPYVHEYRLQYAWHNPLAFLSPPDDSLLLPFSFPSLTWNPPCCDRIRPPRSQVARKLNSPFPSPCSYTPCSRIPTPWGFSHPNIFIRMALRTWLTRSSTMPIRRLFCILLSEYNAEIFFKLEQNTQLFIVGLGSSCAHKYCF